MIETSPRIRLVLSDMDGTVLDSDKQISLRTKEAVRELAARGIPLALVSARIPAAVLPYVKQLGLEGPCAGFNGGVFFTPEGKILKSHHFPVADLTALMEVLEDQPVEVWFQTEQQWLLRDSETPLAVREREMTGITPYEVPELPCTAPDINRLIVSSTDTALIARLEAELGPRFAGRASMLRSAPHKLNITPACATKGQAVAELAAFYGFNPQNVAALGDAHNDIPMLQAAGMGIAMGQAPEAVREQADHVTTTPDEGGWAYAAERFIIPAGPLPVGGNSDSEETGMTTDMRHATVDVLKDADAVAMKMAELLIEKVKDKPEGKFRIALSGGSTPKRLFSILARPEMAKQVDWSRVEIFYGDERYVADDHADSNHASARELLLSKVNIPADQIHPMPTTTTAREDAARYQAVLEKAYGADRLEPGRPLFDIVMLGLGTDGHTASLFPGEPILEEKKAWVGVSDPSTAPHERLSLTYPAIASSALVVFLITGENKVPMLARLRQGDGSIPSGRIVSEGQILILADRAAAGEPS